MIISSNYHAFSFTKAIVKIPVILVFVPLKKPGIDILLLLYILIQGFAELFHSNKDNNKN